MLILCLSLQPKTIPDHKRRVSRLLSKERQKRRQIETLGIDYEFPGYWNRLQSTRASKPSSHTLFVDS